jgi:hypothetical protein
MANILASSNTVSLDPVIICCTTVTTVFNNFSRELTGLSVVAVQEPGRSVSLLRVDLPLELGVPEVVVAAVLPRSAAAKETAGEVGFEENTLPVIVFWLFSVTSASVAAPSHV